MPKKKAKKLKELAIDLGDPGFNRHCEEVYPDIKKQYIEEARSAAEASQIVITNAVGKPKVRRGEHDSSATNKTKGTPERSASFII